MRSLSITGLIAVLTVGTVVLLAAAPPSAQDQETGNRPPFWPGTKGRPVLKEWYTDIPWHQKLGTFAGNEIDEALVLPFEPLGEQERKFCTDHKLTQEDCMLELGINNVLGTLRTDSCHVIKKIEIDPEDTMLSKAFRDRLATRVAQSTRPFLSYIGTDLLMHDMGYLSQVGNASESVRDGDGVVKEGFENYVQKIRTPALKGLRFNRFVTDSHKNTKSPGDTGGSSV
jgi:hypothetical protein